MEEKALQREEVRATMQPIQRSLCHQLLVLASVHVIQRANISPSGRADEGGDPTARSGPGGSAAGNPTARRGAGGSAEDRDPTASRTDVDPTTVAVLSDTQAAVQRTPIQRLGRIQLCALRAIQRLRSIHLFA
ncbi:hypothetical protein OIU76_011610 [Salix suchowensis]|nr:hypothetical protein OIU76_011610 [Salix suchowensis]